VPHLSIGIIRATDDQVIRTLASVWHESGEPAEATYSVSTGFGAMSGKIADIDNDKALNEVRRMRISAMHALVLHLRRPHDLRASVTRADQGDQLQVHAGDNVPAEVQNEFLIRVRKAFAPQDLAGLEKSLGKEATEFYRRREETLVRLQTLNEQLVTDAVATRKTLEAENVAYRRRLDQESDARRAELESDYLAKTNALNERESALEARIKELDDRAPTHARRQLREDLKRILQQRNESFALTKQTAGKRTPIHILFIVLLLSTGGLAGVAFGNVITPPAGIAAWVLLMRFGLAAAAFLAAVAFYIRWIDSWAKAHADEEFKLKRLELDIDRASWVVEMALEWRAARGTQIPAELLDRLTSNLFTEQGGQRKLRHPSEDLASALLRASASLRIPLPGVGELRLDRKAMERFERATAPELDLADR
jgi:hypothetical protein